MSYLAMIGGTEVLLILALVLLLFGGKKLPELARSLGQGIREFKKASQEIDDEIRVVPSSKQEKTQVRKESIDLPPQEQKEEELSPSSKETHVSTR